MSNQVLAFAGAEGYGAYTVGGRGGEVVKVTNLEDSGPGSLRWALEEVEGPRTVVFEVNGVITLKQQILITEPNVTIAGQTALGDGITIEGSRIRVKADEVVIRGLKFRPGDGETGMDAGDRDGLLIGTTDFRIDNVIVDHNSFTWGVDENVSINGFVKDVTISNNIIAEGLSHSVHPKGEHSKGLLISNWGSKESDVNTNISIVKNLFASNMQRNPEVRAGQEIEIVNNYIYNYGLAHTAMFIGAGTGGQLETTVHAIGNVFDPGPDTPNYKVPIALSSMGKGSGVFLSDNLWTKIGTDGAGNQAQVKLAWDQGGMKYLTDREVFAGSNVKILDSQDVKAYVLANAGASPGQRDAVDARIIASTGDKTGRIVDSVAEAGGHAANTAVRHAADSDGDGMPNWFEDVYGLDSSVANANGDSDRDGFTNVEEYINGLISGFDLRQSGRTTVATLEAGAERVVVEALESGRHVIRNFNAAEGDKLDLSKLLTGYDPAIHKIDDFVEAVTVAGRTVISVDRDGAGGKHVMEYVGELESVGPFGSLAEVILSKSAAPAAQAPLRNVVAVADRLTVDKNGLLQLPNGILTLNDTREGTGALVVDEVSGVSGGTVSIDEFGQIIFTATANFTGIAGFQYRLKGVEGDGGRGQVTIDVMREMTGGAGDDVITGGADRVRIDAGGGDDRITAGAGGDVILAGSGQDNVVAGAGDDQVSGGDGEDRLLGGAGRDTLFGDAGDDTLYGEDGDDSLHGGVGADLRRRRQRHAAGRRRQRHAPWRRRRRHHPRRDGRRRHRRRRGQRLDHRRRRRRSGQRRRGQRHALARRRQRCRLRRGRRRLAERRGRQRRPQGRRRQRPDRRRRRQRPALWRRRRGHPRRRRRQRLALRRGGRGSTDGRRGSGRVRRRARGQRVRHHRRFRCGRQDRAARRGVRPRPAGTRRQPVHRDQRRRDAEQGEHSL